MLQSGKKCCFLLNYRKYRTNLTPTDRETVKRSTTTQHRLPTKERAWDKRLDASLENYLGKELLASGQLNESDQFTPGTAQHEAHL